MKTAWIYSKKMEAQRIINCASHIAGGFFAENNFVVVPYGLKIIDPNVVIFPNLSYHQIPRFWEKVQKIDNTCIPIKTDEKLTNKVKNLVNDKNFPLPNYDKVRNTWEKAQNEIVSTIENFIPQKGKAIKSIAIYPTLFGTNTSFNIPKSYPADFSLWLREDQDIHAITEALISSLTRTDLTKKFDGTWSESELLTDWLLTESILAKVLKKYQAKTNWTPTIKQVRYKQKAKLIKVSEDFYKKLGISQSQKIFSLNGKMPEIYGKTAKYLSQREREILTLLIRKSGEVASYDEIAEIIFASEEAYSLYTISKTMQRLRDKLEINGVSSNCLQTQRGKGYIFKS